MSQGGFVAFVPVRFSKSNLSESLLKVKGGCVLVSGPPGDGEMASGLPVLQLGLLRGQVGLQSL